MQKAGTVKSSHISLVPTEQAFSRSVKPDSAAVDFSDKTILIAEDNEINRWIVENMLQSVNTNLLCAENGKEAVELTKTHHIDGVLMDIQMPEMDGIEACQLIKQQYPTLPIIAFTAEQEDTGLKQFQELGFDDYVPKPIDQQHLFSVFVSHFSMLFKKAL